LYLIRAEGNARAAGNWSLALTDVNTIRARAGVSAMTSITADDFFYLVEGDTAATDAVYNAGQFILTLYGHAIS
jgi:hypothetical protein